MTTGQSAPIRARRRAINVESHEGTIEVTRVAYGQEETELETIRVPTFATDPAHVKVNGSVTRNMGDYNSVRVEVAVDFPVLPVMSEVERVYGILAQWVEGRLQNELDGAVETRGPGGGNTQAQPSSGDGTRAANAGIRRQLQGV